MNKHEEATKELYEKIYTKLVRIELLIEMLEKEDCANNG